MRNWLAHADSHLEGKISTLHADCWSFPLVEFNLSADVMSLNVRFRAVHRLSEILNLTAVGRHRHGPAAASWDRGGRSFHQPGPLTGWSRQKARRINVDVLSHLLVRHP